ncbi:MAG: CoA transferase [Thermodesulfobacteriota bacterium]|nr:CoA transferase [Thermodesulfobacteriota bacterium]
MNEALEGIRALEWSVAHVGPNTGAILGDLGAEVIKIEQRITGEPARGFVTIWGSPVELPGGRNILFEYANRNKKSITVDVTKEKGKELIYRLVEKADIFLTNYRRKVGTRLGLDYKTLSQYNPRLIYAGASGFGLKGPDSGKGAFDTVGQARSGIMNNIVGEQESDLPPMQIGGAVCDQLTSIMLVNGILTALIARDRLGIGQEVHTSMLGSMINFQAFTVNLSLLRGREPVKVPRTSALNPIANYYKCGDGKWLIMLIVQPDESWHDFCQAFNIPEIENDPRFDTTQNRRKNRRELISILDTIFATKPREEWLKVLEDNDFPCAPINTISELADDPQVIANEYITDFNHPVIGLIKLTGFPITFEKTPATIKSGAPELGQHTEEVLLEIGDYTWDDITELKEQEVI